MRNDAPLDDLTLGLLLAIGIALMIIALTHLVL
jgi:hypothetical protein